MPEPPPDSDPDTDVPEDDTDPDPDTEPGTISVSCRTTSNVLRFVCDVNLVVPGSVQVRFAPTAGGGERVHGSAGDVLQHEVPLYMMQPGTEYTVVAEQLVDGAVVATDSTTLVTRDLPPEARVRLSVTGTSSVPYLGTHSPCRQNAVAVILDTTTGRVVWYEDLDPAGLLGPLDMVRFTPNRTVLGDTSGRLIKVDLLGKRLLSLTEGLDFPKELHHDLIEVGPYVYAIFWDEQGDLLLDGFYVIDASTGRLVRTWRARDALPLPPDATGDFLHTNAIAVAPDGDVYLSIYAQAAVVRLAGDPLSEDFGTPRWVMSSLGSRSGIGNDFVLEDGFTRQHALDVLPNGDLVLLDNDAGDALVIAVDDEIREARVVERYSSGTVNCGPQGTAAVAPGSGNVFVGCVHEPWLEYDRTGRVVWEAELECQGTLIHQASRFYPLADW